MRTVRALLTVRDAMENAPLGNKVQADIDLLLQHASVARGVVDAATLPSVSDLLGLDITQHPLASRIVLWRGDITSLKVDAIVNAANSGLLGCFRPNHPCIDNVIHAAAGPRLRDDCVLIRRAQQYQPEPNGTARATRAYNLPSRFVLHTVGPAIERGRDVTPRDDADLISSYRSCLQCASELPDSRSIALCCVSTGVFGFPAARGARIAVATVLEFLANNPTLDRVVFNVFRPEDEELYIAALRRAFGLPLDAPAVSNGQPDVAFNAKLSKATQWLRDADYVLIAGGAGLSAAAGLDYNDRALFKRLFPAMAARGHRCMYEFIGFTNWTPELQWGYLLSQLDKARYNWPLSSVYGNLLAIAQSRAAEHHFVLTSNADGMFERNGFDKTRVYTAQGEYGRMQCLKPCTQQVWPTRPLIDAALPFVDPATQEITNADVVPRCPNCGGPVMMNVRGGNWFIDQPYRELRAAFHNWLKSTRDKRLVVIEVGAGFNTPMVVRYPCEDAVEHNPQARFIRINTEHSEVPSSLTNRSVSFDQDATTVLERLRAGLNLV
ncbi:appr-1-p processing enzyme family protein [Capsaspora owczarzaki ATCC 30864]|uniref:Appr-1-p processing enzyme family protein n=2 Tax=Capsaspora owczarzaki (strain ATCC 30864) TaxID=595528 RepID=A0A0D2UI13_CAPO3|nr:appr-1-p processing enzyme family protein [Capsaspora owczarzaki ATCC 30864]